MVSVYREDYDMESWKIGEVEALEEDEVGEHQASFRFFLTAEALLEIGGRPGLDLHVQGLLKAAGRPHLITEVVYHFVGAGEVGGELQATYLFQDALADPAA